ncbi:hypothetical protein EVB67_040 [Rhizobium phage RHph_TM3_3_14B]|nr:hypothetical protein EVB67_040 [Rhizobium phage RHph_TM3_3_14B]
MTRQMKRAALRRQAKIDRASERKPGSYPASRYVPVTAIGKRYPFSSARQNAKYAQAAA